MLLFEQLAEFGHKGIDILKLTVDRSEANVSHFINALELVHNEFADLLGGYLAIERILKGGFNVIDNVFKCINGNRALFAGAQQTVKKLVAVENLARVVLLYNDDGKTFDDFVCSETLLALKTFSAAAYSFAFIGRS